MTEKPLVKYERLLSLSQSSSGLYYDPSQPEVSNLEPLLCLPLARLYRLMLKHRRRIVLNEL